uniref:Uncharacterized protein n=1 Tax=Monodon monoceros TaxID=40151 RepID=A0A8C6BG42_MONMO
MTSFHTDLSECCFTELTKSAGTILGSGSRLRGDLAGSPGEPRGRHQEPLGGVWGVQPCLGPSSAHWLVTQPREWSLHHHLTGQNVLTKPVLAN